MSHYKSFAVAGVGGIGSPIISALAQQPGVTVVALTRAGSSKSFPEGVTSTVVDYESEESLVAALKGVEVVVSTLAGAGFLAQPALANAAKKAGVKLFVPSEFGLQTHLLNMGIFRGKVQLREHLKSIGLPATLYYTGAFAEAVLRPWFGIDQANAKAVIVGTGNEPASFTTTSDIGYFVAYTLTHLPPAELHDRVLAVEGDRKSLNEAFAIFEKVKGIKFAVEHRNLQEVKTAIGPEPGMPELPNFIAVVIADGIGTVGKPDNALVPGWAPETLEQVIAKYY